MRKDADLPLATTPITVQRPQTMQVLDLATRIVIGALGVAFVFLMARIVGQF